MENKPMTVRDVVEQIVNDLGVIEVKMCDIERYGIPIGRAIAGLNQVLAAWDAQEKEEKQEQNGEEPEVKLELLSAEDAEEDNG